MNVGEKAGQEKKAPGSPQEGAAGVWHPESHAAAAPCFAAGLNVNVAKELFWEGLCALPALWVETFCASAFGISLAALSCSLGVGWW